jgi:glycogen debranching enzyme
LMIYSELAGIYWNVAEAAEFAHRAEIVKEAFRRTFWNEATGCLFDYVNGYERDGAIRPNQIFALSLPFPLIQGEQARSVLRIIEEKLYTPVGLRSLSPDDPAYKPHYTGNQKLRDSAYHQGTVWSWLLGPLAHAIVSVEGESGRARAKRVLEGILPHLQEAGIGTISEIFDGDTPHAPRGCIAQAWSVGEILRAYVEDAHCIDGRIEPATARTRQARREHAATRSSAG